MDDLVRAFDDLNPGAPAIEDATKQQHVERLTVSVREAENLVAWINEKTSRKVSRLVLDQRCGFLSGSAGGAGVAGSATTLGAPSKGMIARGLKMLDVGNGTHVVYAVLLCAHSAVADEGLPPAAASSTPYQQFDMIEVTATEETAALCAAFKPMCHGRLTLVRDPSLGVTQASLQPSYDCDTYEKLAGISTIISAVADKLDYYPDTPRIRAEYSALVANMRLVLEDLRRVRTLVSDVDVAPTTRETVLQAVRDVNRLLISSAASGAALPAIELAGEYFVLDPARRTALKAGGGGWTGGSIILGPALPDDDLVVTSAVKINSDDGNSYVMVGLVSTDVALSAFPVNSHNVVVRKRVMVATPVRKACTATVLQRMHATFMFLQQSTQSNPLSPFTHHDA
jgi:hypothetical protein